MTVSGQHKKQEILESHPTDKVPNTISFFAETGGRIFSPINSKNTQKFDTVKFFSDSMGQLKASLERSDPSVQSMQAEWIRGTEQSEIFTCFKDSFLQIIPIEGSEQKFGVHVYPRILGGGKNHTGKEKPNPKKSNNPQQTPPNPRNQPKKEEEIKNGGEIAHTSTSASVTQTNSSFVQEENRVTARQTTHSFQDPIGAIEQQSISPRETTSLQHAQNQGGMISKMMKQSHQQIPMSGFLPSSPAAYSEAVSAKTAPYIKELDELITQIKSFPNPFTAEKVVEFLTSYTLENGRIAEPSKGLECDESSFPNSIRLAIDALNLSFHQAETQEKDIAKLIHNFRKDLKQSILNLKIDRSHIWKELEPILKIPGVIRLPYAEQMQVISLFKGESAPKVDRELRVLFEKYGMDLEEVEVQLKTSNPKANLRSIVSQAIINRPRILKFAEELYKASPNSFNGKVLKQGGKDLGVIRSFDKKSDGSCYIVLQTSVPNREVTLFIDSNCNTTKTTIEKITLSSALEDPLIHNSWLTVESKDEFLKGKQFNVNQKTGKVIIYSPNSMDEDPIGYLSYSRDGDLIITKMRTLIDEHQHISRQEINRFLHFFRKVGSETIATSKEGLNDLFSLSSEYCDPQEQERAIQKKIAEESNRLSNLLLERSETFNSLLDSLYENKLKDFDSKLLDREIKLQIDKLKILYSEKLREEVDEKKILIDALLNANYVSQVNKLKDDTNEIAHAREVSIIMEMLEKSEQYRDQFQGKNGILFIGPTGAGKSLTIGRLLENEVQEQKNALGETIYKYINPSPTAPHVGHSIASSETLYTQGHPSKEDSDLFFLDTAGSSETRGGAYEICGRMSLDRAVDALSELRSIVFVIPASYFVLSRGALLMDFFTGELDRFPELFNSKSDAYRRAFILVTKTHTLEDDTLSSLRGGKIFETNISELKERKKGLESSVDGSKEALSFLERNLNIWEIVRNIANVKHFDLMDPLDDILLDQLKEKYKLQYSIGLAKQTYVTGMQSPDLIGKYERSLSSYANSWTRVFGEFDDLKKKIIASKEFISNLQKEELNIRNKEKEEEERISEEINNLNTRIENVKNKNISLEQLLSEEAHSEEEVNKHLITKPETIKRKRDALITSVERTCGSIEAYIERIWKNFAEKLFLDSAKPIFENSITALSTGDYSNPIIAIPGETGWAQTLYLGSVSKEAKKKAMDDIEHIPTEELKDMKTHVTKDYRGRFDKTIPVHQSYPLLPVGDEFLKQFRENANEHQFGDYRIEVKPKYATVVERNANQKASGVCYRILFNWAETQGDPKNYPYIAINHIIPNREYNSEDIRELRQKIARNEQEVASLDEQRKQLEGEYEERTQDLGKDQRDLVESIKLEQREKEQAKAMTLANWIENARNKILSLDKQKVDNKHNSQVRSVRYQKEIEAERAELQKNEKTKRNLSIVIFTKIESAKTLLKLANLSLKKSETPQKNSHALPLSNGTNFAQQNHSNVNKKALENACEAFIKVFNEKNVETILAECKETLCLS